MKRNHIGHILLCALIATGAVSQIRGDHREVLLATNMKMLGQACLLYADNNDQRFPPTMVSHPVQAQDIAWQELILPWLPYYGARYNPLRRIATDDGSEAARWRSFQHFAIYPRAASSASAVIRTSGYFAGVHSGVANVRWDGIAGFTNLAPPQIDWLGRQACSSLSQSQVNDYETCMVMESTNWDAWASIYVIDSNPMGACLRWTPENFSAEGTRFVFCGPTATIRPKSDGIIRDGIHACAVPAGIMGYVNVEGSFMAVDFRAYFYNGVPSRRTAGEYWIRALNPAGK